MTEILLGLALVLLLAILALTIVTLIRRPGADLSALQPRFDSLDSSLERVERAFREEMGRNREEAASAAKQLREELSGKVTGLGDSLQARLREDAGFQQQQLETIRTVVDAKLKQIQEDNARQLDQMRITVDEKLQSTLERRLGESFKQVSERLEQVHKGLGEMQTLATGVGDLKRVLTNVKTRGGWGEVQLGALLEEILTPGQYERNVKTKETSNEAVEFALKLPGRGETDGEALWVPIDAKFPTEDYQRLLEAQEHGDAEAAQTATKMLANRVKACAKDICEKYLNPPTTTEFGIMFLPTEGLYGEVARTAGLIETVQRESHVTVMGPTLLHGYLISLQMGFRTLAIQKRSGEVWKLLGGVKSEFGKFGELLDGVKRKLDQASNTMDDVAQRSRAIERRLRNVQELPAAEAKVSLTETDDSAPAESE